MNMYPHPKWTSILHHPWMKGRLFNEAHLSSLEGEAHVLGAEDSLGGVISPTLSREEDRRVF